MLLALTLVVGGGRSSPALASHVSFVQIQQLGAGTPNDIALGDLDGDGDLDAFVADIGANQVWTNDGNGVFTDSSQSLGTSTSFAVALGDVDSDGDLDAVIANYANQTNKLWLNNGSGVFTDSGQTLGNGQTTDVYLGDLDGDSDLDIFFIQNGGGQKVWLNNGSGTFASNGQTLGASNSFGGALGDVDGDGDLDAIVANPFASSGLWLNDGTGQFTVSGQAINSARDIALGDLDGDGDLDAFLARNDNTTIPGEVWTNNGSGVFTNSGQSLSGQGESNSAVLSDVDGDGALDAFVTSRYGIENWVNNGSGAFTDEWSVNFGYSNGFYDTAFGDIDGDGDPDALTAGGLFSSGVHVWRNDTVPAIFLDIPDDLTGNQAGTVDVPLNLTVTGDAISALNFTVGFNAACLSLDTTDGNSDGVPDAVVLNQSTGFQISANSSNAATGSLGLVISTQASDPPATFSNGAVATITFSIVCGDESTDLTLSNASFGNSQGASVTGTTDGGAVDINRPPVAVDDVSKTTPATAVTIDVLANDTDPDTDDSHTVANVTTPSNGTAAIVNNEVVYTPDAGFLGLDSFDYTISDGRLSDTGTVQVAVGIRGDANADVTVDAGDLPAVVLEIFDGDGSGWLATLGGTFAGNPVGSDSNEDESITAGDLSCTVRLLLFGVNDPCTAVLRSGAKASLSLPTALSVQDGVAQVPVHFTANGNQAAALALALEIDEAQVAFDAADNNGDGLPDGVQIVLDGGFQAMAVYKAGLLNLVIFSPELKALADGTVATLSLAVASGNSDSPAVRFSASQPASAGGVDGATVPVQIDNDAVGGVNQPAQQLRLFLPTVGR